VRIAPQLRLPGRWRINPVIAAGMAGALLLVLALGWTQFFLPGRSRPQIAAIDLEADRRLMLQVDQLVENALPPEYQQLIAASDIDLDEDLIDWIIPSIEESDDSLL
jgi:hypothetical protein